MPAPGLCGVILAAGASTRMGTDKALLAWCESTFLGSAIEALYPFSEYVIVVGGKNTPTIEPVISTGNAYLAVNPNPELGQFSSLRVGLQEVLDRGRDAAMVTLVDRPPARRETIQQLCDGFTQARAQGFWAVVPRYGERNGHPLIMGRELIAAFMGAPVSSNAREVWHQHSSKVLYIPVDDTFVTANVDTPEQYAQLTAQ